LLLDGKHAIDEGIRINIYFIFIALEIFSIAKIQDSVNEKIPAIQMP
jgi:hypothetical protein